MCKYLSYTRLLIPLHQAQQVRLSGLRPPSREEAKAH